MYISFTAIFLVSIPQLLVIFLTLAFATAVLYSTTSSNAASPSGATLPPNAHSQMAMHKRPPRSRPTAASASAVVTTNMAFIIRSGLRPYTFRRVPAHLDSRGEVDLDVLGVVGVLVFAVAEHREAGRRWEGGAQDGADTTASRNDCRRGTASVRFLNPNMALSMNSMTDEEDNEHEVLQARLRRDRVSLSPSPSLFATTDISAYRYDVRHRLRLPTYTSLRKRPPVFLPHICISIWVPVSLPRPSLRALTLLLAHVRITSYRIAFL
ncbi:hypothetical protein C8R45DRAFT_1174062 [Mycena sanguinolenta]|nr:hypothetical protein C8R45DRAFT_1174062 [Mycena sanguinolenta]